MHLILSLLLSSAAAEVPARPAVGDAAPSFTLPATTGKDVSLADFKGKKTVVLAFFPKAFTGGCTKEMTGYTASHSDFTGIDTQVLGVSMDDLDTQKKFAESLKAPFPMLADPEGKAATAYGVVRELPNGSRIANRVTFIIGKDGKVQKTIEGNEALDPSIALSACKQPK